MSLRTVWRGLALSIISSMKSVEVVEVHFANGVSKLVLELIHFVLQSPHFPNGSLDDFTKVGLLLSHWDQLWLHLCPDSLNKCLYLFRNVVVKLEHLVEDEGPFLKVEHKVIGAHDDVCEGAVSAFGNRVTVTLPM